MCRKRRRAVAIVVLCAHWLWADGNSWNKIRYAGGTVAAKVNPYDWNTTLTVTPDKIILMFAHRTTLELAPSQVTALSYGQEAHRRVADMVTLSVLFLNPLMLFGILHQSKNHFIGIEFRTADAKPGAALTEAKPGAVPADGKPGAVLLEADKNNYRAILEALKTVTGKPVRNAP